MSRHHDSLKIKAVTVFTSRGARPSQEDYVLVDRERGIFVVADGFGGPVPGALASKTACESVKTYLHKEAGDLEATMPFVLRKYFSLAGNVLFNSLIHANRKVLALNQGKNVHEKGGTSVLAGFIDGDLLALANIGTCNAWLFRGDQGVELVSPRSYGKMADPISESVQEHMQVPLMAVGMTDDIEPEITEFKVVPGDWVVILTDGVPVGFRREITKIKQKLFIPENSARIFSEFLERENYQDNAAISLIIF